MVEILFHVLPLWVLLTTVSLLPRHNRSEAIVWVSLMVVALVEPAFQIWTATRGTPVVGAPHA
jgi:hypothetical protein